jgi:hypothetical protein
MDDAIKECLSVASELHRHSKGDEHKRGRAGYLFSWSAYHILQKAEISAAMRETITTFMAGIDSASTSATTSASTSASTPGFISASASSWSSLGLVTASSGGKAAKTTAAATAAAKEAVLKSPADCIPDHEAIDILNLLANPCDDNFAAVRHTATFQLFKDRILKIATDPTRPLTTISFLKAAGDFELLSDALVDFSALNEATVRLVEDMTGYITPEVLTSSASAPSASNTLSSLVTSVLPNASLYSQLFRSDGFVPQIVRWIAVLTDLATCRGIDCISAVRTELYPQYAEIRLRLATALSHFVEKVTQCGGDDLVSAYVHVASAFTGDAVEELHHMLLKALSKIHMSYIATKPAKKKEDWQAVFPADVLSGQSSLLDDLRTVLTCD